MTNRQESLDYYLDLNYPVTIQYEGDGGMVVEIEDLPGCISQGETIEEAMEAIQAAKIAWLETAYEDDISIPIPRTEQTFSGRILMRVPKSLHRRLIENARREGISLNQYACHLLSSGAEISDTQKSLNQISEQLNEINRSVRKSRVPSPLWNLAFPVSGVMDISKSAIGKMQAIGKAEIEEEMENIFREPIAA
jgi:antitoxin HicB